MRCFTRNRLIVIPAYLIFVGIGIGAIVQPGTPWWCDVLGIGFLITGVACLWKDGVYSRLCFNADQVGYRDFDWGRFRTVSHVFDVSAVRSIETRQKSMTGVFGSIYLVIDWAKGGEIELDRAMWWKGDLAGFILMVRERVPNVRLDKDTEKLAAYAVRHHRRVSI
jgi:hypothetical protein